MARQFHINSRHIKESAVLLDAEESHHAVKVLRLKNGHAIELFDGEGNSYSGTVLGLKNGRLEVSLNERDKKREENVDCFQISIAVSVIRSERMEMLVEKCSELGAHSIHPLITHRSIIRMPRERWASKIERWQKIARESCKQCGRNVIPTVHETETFEKFISQFKTFDRILMPTLAAPRMSIQKTLDTQKPKKILLLIGPEGDFTKEEVEKAVVNGAKPVTLGPFVLRTETAAIYLLSALNFYLNYNRYCVD